MVVRSPGSRFSLLGSHQQNGNITCKRYAAKAEKPPSFKRKSSTQAQELRLNSHYSHNGCGCICVPGWVCVCVCAVVCVGGKRKMKTNCAGSLRQRQRQRQHTSCVAPNPYLPRKEQKICEKNTAAARKYIDPKCEMSEIYTNTKKKEGIHHKANIITIIS